MTVVAWAAALVLVIGVAAAGGGVDQRPAAGPVASGVAVEGADVPDSGRSGLSLLVLQTPARRDVEVTTPDLVVRGHVAAGLGPVRIGIESSSGKIIEMTTLDPTPGATASEPATFAVRFPLSNPRPGGTMVVDVTVYDGHGIPLDATRRRVRIGALIEPTYGGVDGRPATGEDGLMGGITYGTNVAPVDEP